MQSSGADNASNKISEAAIQAVKDVLDTVTTSLEDSKAEELVTIDITGKTAIADYMVVASGRSNRHVGAIADHLLRTLKKEGHGSAKVEGLDSADWVLVDVGDVIVHLFRPEVREFYALEKMWQMPPSEEVN
jgi:ribosome-associated protein